VVIKDEETLLREELSPGVSFVARLPDGMIRKSYKDGLGDMSIQRRIDVKTRTVDRLKYECCTIELGKSN